MYKIVVLTISDRCSSLVQEDETGKVVMDIIKSLPSEIMQYDIVPDDPDLIKNKLIKYCDNLKANLVLTNGGTGFSPRDNTPEATKEIVDRAVPGIAELIRSEGFKKTPRAVLSRGVSGIRKNTLIINLPGSVKGAKESLEIIMPVIAHAIDMIKGKDH